MTWGQAISEYFALDEVYYDLLAHVIGGTIYAGTFACLYCLLVM